MCLRRLLSGSLEVPLHAGEVLLLSVELLVQAGDSGVLRGRKGFELNPAFFDGRQHGRLRMKRACFVSFYVEAPRGLP